MSLKDKYLEYKELIFTKYWNDPVWSKVISAAIITIVGSIITTIYVVIKSLYEKVSFKTVGKELMEYFKNFTEINNTVIWIVSIILVSTIIIFLKSFIPALIDKFKNKKKEIPKIHDHSTVFFLYRLGDAFPGQRGLKWYDSKTAVERLKILLREPLRFEPVGYEVMPDPIWWFRGGSALHINHFKTLSKTKVLINIDEIEIKRFAVFISDSYYKSFIYLEAQAEKQTGLYNLDEEAISNPTSSRGYSSEEFGLYKNKPITREEYDDGSAVINGKVVATTNVELRKRFLSDYNMIIAAKQSPYNSRKFSRETKEIFNDILKDSSRVDDFFKYLDSYEKDENLK